MFIVVVVLSMLSAVAALECFVCVYDPQKDSETMVWNRIRPTYEKNDWKCKSPNPYRPGDVTDVPIQRCGPKQFCNKQTWQLQNTQSWYVARACSDQCYNDIWKDIDLRDKGYERPDIHYSCCKEERCNGANSVTGSLIFMTSLVGLTVYAMTF